MAVYCLWLGDAATVPSSSLRIPDDPTDLPDATDLRVAPDLQRRGTLRRQVVQPARSGGPDDLVVLVVSHARQPIPGFPVALSKERQLHARDSKPEIVRTDASGHAVFRSRRLELVASPEPWYLVHDVQFAEQPFVRLDRRRLAPSSVVVSVQPPYGSVEVVAIEDDGTPARTLDTASLALITSAEADDPTLAWQRTEWRRRFRHGTNRARFEYVELGHEWMAGASRSGEQTSSAARGCGPTAHGAACQIRVVMGLDHPVAVYRAVDVHGTPLSRAELLVTRAMDWGGTSRHEIVTGTDGRFAVNGGRSLFGGQHLTITYDPRSLAFVATGRLTGSVLVPDGLKNGRNDCGDVVLRANAPLVSGHVVDRQGRPVPNVRVRAGPGVYYEAQGIEWLGGDKAETRTDELGSFVMFGEIPHREFRVWVDAGTTWSDAVNARRGDENIRLICYEACVPSVDVILSEGVSWDGVEIRLRPAGSKGHGVGTTGATQQGDTVHVSLSAVRPGLYDLLWAIHGEPLGRRDRISIERGGKIATIDLRRSVFRHDVTLVEGRDVPHPWGGTLFWRPSGTADGWRALDFPKSPIRLTAPARSIDLRVYPRGYREEARNGVARPCTIHLRPGIRVRLILRTTGQIPEPPYIFDPAPMVHGKWVGEPIGSRYFTKTKREAVFLLPAGRIDVGWHLERRSKNGAVGSTVLARHQVVIDVKESNVEQTFYLNLDGGALDRLLENLHW